MKITQQKQWIELLKVSLQWLSRKGDRHRPAKGMGFLIVLGLAGYWTISYATLTLAQNAPAVMDRLPAPPPIPSGTPSAETETAPITDFPAVDSTPVAPDKTSEVREYNFEAPPSEVEPSVPSSSTATSSFPELYRVEVTGDTDPLLSQVKSIEPLAFIRPGEGVIQAGLFQNPQQAEERAQQLASQGISATVVTVNYGTGSKMPMRRQI